MKLATAQKTRKAICFKFNVRDHRAATSDSAIEKRPDFAAPVHRIVIRRWTTDCVLREMRFTNALR